MNVDLRPYAERLAKAMPERFLFKHDNEGYWYLPTLKPEYPGVAFYAELDADSSEGQQWAFFGPLVDEFGLKAQHLANVIPVVGGTLPGGMLEVVAEAVCQAAERRAGGAA